MEIAETTEYLSIGEVLSQLKVEFEEVSISKIRFLEAQGLMRLERSPAGYRQFYPVDIARLRGEGASWIVLHEMLPNAIIPLSSELTMRMFGNEETFQLTGRPSGSHVSKSPNISAKSRCCVGSAALVIKSSNTPRSRATRSTTAVVGLCWTRSTLTLGAATWMAIMS